MGLISVDQLKKDMVLASDVKDLSGRLLAAKGLKLSEGHLRLFETWGILEADIEGESSGDTYENAFVDLEPGLLKTAEEFVRRRFVHSDLDHPANQQLFQLCVLQTAERLARDKGLSQPPSCRDGDEEPECDDNGGPENYRIDPVHFVQQVVSLPALPVVVSEMMEIIRDPNSSARKMAEAIGRDVGLSAKIMKLVNSAFFGYPSQIDTLFRAVVVLGTNQLSTLATGIKMVTFFENIPTELVDMKSFLDHSITCGILSRMIGFYKSIQNTERLFLGGLLHDIGRLVLYSHFPVGAKAALVEAECNQGLLYKAEGAIFGCDHAEVGSLLMKRWKLPVSLEVAVRYHHEPQRCNDPLEASIVHLADVITNAVEKGSSGERFIPPLSKAAWEFIGLSARILPIVLEQMEIQREAVVHDLLRDNGD